MLLLVLTSYLFVQGPRLWAWHNFFFCPTRLFPVFDRLASLDRPRFLRFPKKVMKVFTHNFKTLSVYPAIQSMFCHLFSLFTFNFNHVLSFPGSACYHAEVLGFLIRDFFSIFSSFFFGLFSLPTDRQTQNQGLTHSTVNKKSKWPKK